MSIFSVHIAWNTRWTFTTKKSLHSSNNFRLVIFTHCQIFFFIIFRTFILWQNNSDTFTLKSSMMIFKFIMYLLQYWYHFVQLLYMWYAFIFTRVIFKIRFCQKARLCLRFLKEPGLVLLSNLLDFLPSNSFISSFGFFLQSILCCFFFYFLWLFFIFIFIIWSFIKIILTYYTCT